MSDLVNRLAALHDDSPGDVGDSTVTADLRRGHAAFVSRRRRRRGVAGAATLGIVAAGSVSYAVTSGSASGPQAGPPPSVSTHHPSTSAPAHPTRSSSTTGAGPALRLVAYQGKQLPGYTVTEIPQGYVLQGISGSVLDVAEQNDHSPLNTFSGKMVVMLNDYPALHQGTPVQVGGRPGWLRQEGSGVRALSYTDGKDNVEVQAWSNITLTDQQLVAFAEGVTVLPDAQVGHG